MHLTPKTSHVEHFRLLYERHFGVALEGDEARETLTRLAQLYLDVTAQDVRHDQESIPDDQESRPFEP
ncbi:hypothetical protein [Armatimonas rosea]|uniref:Uncharacterized protein n=1 Tax=Armatimonas rosea TaxID=685828 RepID=A0A7W9W707_ARMRO|nr:hypothetical protein [Armatimonas rosea]MBB6050731.1 hypothetical protein [Armatimonas rosea]